MPRIEKPTGGICKNCGWDALEFYDDGNGLCRKCGRVFNWLEAERIKHSYQEPQMGFGLYQNRGDIRRALDTGAKPNFVLSALVHQGMNRDEAYRMVNEILQELSSVKHSRQNYLDDMISSFDRDEDGDFGWWERDSRRPKSRARPPRSARREGSEFESIPVESDKMYKKGFDSSYPEDGDDSDLTGDDDDFDIFEDDSDSAEDQKDPSKKSGLDIDDDISISLPNQDETDSDDFDDDSVEVDWLDVDLKKRKKR